MCRGLKRNHAESFHVAGDILNREDENAACKVGVVEYGIMISRGAEKKNMFLKVIVRYRIADLIENAPALVQGVPRLVTYHYESGCGYGIDYPREYVLRKWGKAFSLVYSANIQHQRGVVKVVPM
ncbi:hypothetical protein TspCOW1_31720 [Thiohalobacter sp. COW1]|nr:hypothetical protein TspCOW1_31720 [Thiohalobacter sp. COW1]